MFNAGRELSCRGRLSSFLFPSSRLFYSIIDSASRILRAPQLNFRREDPRGFDSYLRSLPRFLSFFFAFLTSATVSLSLLHLEGSAL